MQRGGADSPSAREARGLGYTGEIWLSILVPVYNVRPYLAECLQSILMEMMGGVEVILLDDHSTDGSGALCENFCERTGGAFRMLANAENRGVGFSRNALLEYAAGDYVWYVDSDDCILPGTVARLRAIIRDHRPDIVMGDYIWRGRRRASFAGVPNELRHDAAELIRGVFANRRLHLWSKVCRRSLWGSDLRFPDIRCYEDVAVTPQLLLRARSHYYSPEPWVFYRVRRQSLTALVSRTAGAFKDRENDSLAFALRGYCAAVKDLMPDVAESTLFPIAHFCAREFTKISARLIGAEVARGELRGIRRRLNRYRVLMEDCSPIRFGGLVSMYRSRGRFFSSLVLEFFLLVAGAPKAMTIGGRQWSSPTPDIVKLDEVGRNHHGGSDHERGGSC